MTAIKNNALGDGDGVHYWACATGALSKLITSSAQKIITDILISAK
ncbi:MAG: hypothetical protein IJL18_05345 [Synergistaceae bacterium]|nr:hypothetical protein [Synergistaceae bacterium]MBQ6002258.1 hypothetical protein [Synergistaceae bacterium]MBR0168797.1 hypothetical protein [Synergistaceae bacterium]MBR0278374.1 hypothetical protein [Synergistaceae bacterium]